MGRSAGKVSEAPVGFVQDLVLLVLHPFYLPKQESLIANQTPASPLLLNQVLYEVRQTDMYRKLKNIKQLYVAALTCVWWEVGEAAYFIAQNPNS